MAVVDDLRAYARAAATRNGIDPDRFEKQVQQESGFNPDAHNDGSDADGIAQIVVRWHPAMDGKTRDPHASLDYAADLMRSHLAARNGDWALALSNYNAGAGATSQGLAGTLAGWPYPETVRYVATILGISRADAAARLTGAQPMSVTYNASEPAIAQNDPWSCAPTSTRWAMTALGRHPSEAWMESQMLSDGIVSKEEGLRIATGGPLATWITEQYGEFGYSASNDPSVSFDDVAAEAGKYPLLLGGRAWGHWSGVRGLSASTDTLLLANPADGWMGVGQTMNRQQFAAVGPFSMVRVTHPDLAPVPVPPVPPPAPDPKDQRIAELEAQVASLRADLADRNSKLGYASVDVAGAVDAISSTLKGLKP